MICRQSASMSWPNSARRRLMVYWLSCSKTETMHVPLIFLFYNSSGASPKNGTWPRQRSPGQGSGRELVHLSEERSGSPIPATRGPREAYKGTEMAQKWPPPFFHFVSQDRGRFSMHFRPYLLTFRFFAHNVDVASPRMPSLRGALRASCLLLQFPGSRFLHLLRFIAILLAIHCLHSWLGIPAISIKCSVR